MSMTNCWNLRVTAEVNQGGRRYMEDVTAVQFERAKGDKKIVEYAAFAVFDGHGGKEAAHFARDNILDNIKSQKGFFSKDVESVKKAIHDGFITTHHQMWNELPNWPKTYNGHPSTAGTTASLVLIRGNKMYVANVGDSMVVMGTRGNRYKDNPRAFQAMELTVDHKPELPEERKRIENCGGCVMNKAGVNRVVWNRPKISHSGPIRRSTKLDRIPFLAIARSLGDLWSFNSEKNQFIVSPVPDVHVYDLIDGREQFIVLASDGLWNMVRPYESVTMAGSFDERKTQRTVSGTPAHELVQLALDRWKMRAMRADNTSVIVVYIERKKMETAAKKRDTYSESWTSARLENSKFREDNIPYHSADKPPVTTDENSKTDDEISTPSSDTEPVQDNSISSSSGDFNPRSKPTKLGQRGEKSSDSSSLGHSTRRKEHSEDEPTSSVEDTDDNEDKGSEPTRRVTRRLSKEIESSKRINTRSSQKTVEPEKSAEKKTLKRRKSAEAITPVSKTRGQGPSSHKRCKTDFVRGKNQTLPVSQEPKKADSAKKRPRSLERTATKASKSHPKSVPASRSRSEPVLPAVAGTKRMLRERRTPAKHAK